MAQQPLQINGLSPEQTQAWLQSLMQRESSGVNQDNQYGYTGLFQFGADALGSVGLVNTNRLAQAKKQKGYSQKAFLNNPDNWNIEGGKAEYWNNHPLQAKAAVDLANMNLKSLSKYNLDTPGKLAGAAMASHLVGAGGVQKLLGGSNPSDANGTTAKDYFNRGSAAIGSGELFAPSTEQPQYRSQSFKDSVQKDLNIFGDRNKIDIGSSMITPPAAPVPESKLSDMPTPEQIQNSRNLSGEDILYGSPKDATIQSDLSSPNGTFTPESSDEAKVVQQIQNLPEKLRTTLVNNMASLASARVNQPRNYQDVYSPETQKMMENLIDQTGVLNG